MKKKVLGLAGLGLMSLLLTGCGGNKFTCTCEEADEAGREFGNYVFHYDEDWKKIKSIDYEFGYEIYDDEEYDIDEFSEKLERKCERDDAPSDCKVKTSGDKTTLYASGDPDEFGIDENMTKEEIRDEFDSDECSCK